MTRMDRVKEMETKNFILVAIDRMKEMDWKILFWWKQTELSELSESLWYNKNGQGAGNGLKLSILIASNGLGEGHELKKIILMETDNLIGMD